MYRNDINVLSIFYIITQSAVYCHLSVLEAVCRHVTVELLGQVENAEVRKPKYGNRSTETEVRKRKYGNRKRKYAPVGNYCA